MLGFLTLGLAALCPHAIVGLTKYLPFVSSETSTEFEELKKSYEAGSISYSQARAGYAGVMRDAFMPLSHSLNMRVTSMSDQALQVIAKKEHDNLSNKYFSITNGVREMINFLKKIEYDDDQKYICFSRKKYGVKGDLDICAYNYFLDHWLLDETSTANNFKHLLFQIANNTYDFDSSVKYSVKDIKQFEIPKGFLDFKERYIKSGKDEKVYRLFRLALEDAEAMALNTYDEDKFPSNFFGDFNSFLIGDFRQPDIEHYSIYNFLRFPITEYGDVFTKRIYLTTQIFYNIITEHLLFNFSKEVYQKNRMLFHNTDNGGRALSGAFNSNLTPAWTLIEGMITYGQAIIQLMAEKQKIFDGLSYDKVLENILLNSNVMTDMSVRLPFGIVGPMNFSLKHVKESVSTDSLGKYVFSENFTFFAGSLKKDVVNSLHVPEKGQTYADLNPFAFRSGMGCPLGYDKTGYPKGSGETGIDMLAKAYWKVFKATAGIF